MCSRSGWSPTDVAFHLSGVALYPNRVIFVYRLFHLGAIRSVSIIERLPTIPYLHRPTHVLNWELLDASMHTTRRIAYFSGPHSINAYLDFRAFVFRHTVRGSTPAKRRPVFVYPSWFAFRAFDDEPILILFDRAVWAVPLHSLPCHIGSGVRFRGGLLERGSFLVVPGDWGFVAAFGVPVSVPRAVLAEYFRKLDCCL